jgi:predicted DCC family thiol-disulfide oxidoreductase YuxK
VPDSDKPAIWVFDSQCVLCDAGVNYTLKHEKSPSITFVALQSPQGQQLIRDNGLDPKNPSTFLFIENGIALQASDAVIALSRHLNGPAKLGAIGRIIPKPLRDCAYNLIARNRYRIFGRKQMCTLPTADNKHRFIL